MSPLPVATGTTGALRPEIVMATNQSAVPSGNGPLHPEISIRAMARHFGEARP